MKLFHSVAIGTIFYFGLLSSSFASQDEHKAQIDQWIKDMFAVHKAVDERLVLGRFRDPTYYVEFEFTWRPNDPGMSYDSVTVPKGFVTDLTSVPPIFFAKVRPDGEYVLAAIVHDYLYWTQKRSRNEADLIMYEIMEEFEINWLTRNAFYQVLDKFGWLAWNKNSEEQKSGGKRILKEFPSASENWGDWKNNPKVFLD